MNGIYDKQDGAMRICWKYQLRAFGNQLALISISIAIVWKLAKYYKLIAFLPLFCSFKFSSLSGLWFVRQSSRTPRNTRSSQVTHDVVLKNIDNTLSLLFEIIIDISYLLCVPSPKPKTGTNASKRSRSCNTINVFVIILRIFAFFVISVLLKQARIRAKDREAERGERRGDQSHREIATATQGAVGA